MPVYRIGQLSPFLFYFNHVICSTNQNARIWIPRWVAHNRIRLVREYPSHPLPLTPGLLRFVFTLEVMSNPQGHSSDFLCFPLMIINKFEKGVEKVKAINGCLFNLQNSQQRQIVDYKSSQVQREGF